MLQSKIESFYEKHSKSRVCQGDILRDFKFNIVAGDEIIEKEILYVTVVSQDCDLDLNKKNNQISDSGEEINNQFLPNALILPAFTVNEFKEGEHLKELYKVVQERKNQKIIDKIKEQKMERYHFIPRNLDFQIPELIVDFKIHFTIPLGDIGQTYNECYLATINELFRERLSQRFTTFINRIALPELEFVAEQ
jgi:hypothetical protein